MSLELALIAGLIGSAYMTLHTSEKIKKKEDEISATIIALAYLPILGVFYSGYSLAKNASITALTNVYLAGFLLSIVFYIGFLYILIQTYKSRIEDEGLNGL